MDGKQLKAAITADLETLKHLDLDILPSKEYYGAFFKALFTAWLLISAAIMVASIPAVYVDWYDFSHERCDKPWYSSFDDTHAQQENATKKKKYEACLARSAILSNSIELLIGAFAMSICAFIFIYGQISCGIIFLRQLRHKLQTGNFIVKKVKQLLCIAYLIFIVMVSLAYFPVIDCPAKGVSSFVAGVSGTVLALLIINTIINMEFNRIGISVFFELLDEFLEKRSRTLGKKIESND